MRRQDAAAVTVLRVLLPQAPLPRPRRWPLGLSSLPSARPWSAPTIARLPSLPLLPRRAHQGGAQPRAGAGCRPMCHLGPACPTAFTIFCTQPALQSPHALTCSLFSYGTFTKEGPSPAQEAGTTFSFTNIAKGYSKGEGRPGDPARRAAAAVPSRCPAAPLRHAPNATSSPDAGGARLLRAVPPALMMRYPGCA